MFLIFLFLSTVKFFSFFSWLWKGDWRLQTPQSYAPLVLYGFFVFKTEMCLWHIMRNKEDASLQFFTHYKTLIGYREEFKYSEHVRLSFVPWDSGGRHAFCAVHSLSDCKIWKCIVIIKDEIKSTQNMLFTIIIMVYPNTCSPMKAHFCS